MIDPQQIEKSKKRLEKLRQSIKEKRDRGFENTHKTLDNEFDLDTRIGIEKAIHDLEENDYWMYAGDPVMQRAIKGEIRDLRLLQKNLPEDSERIPAQNEALMQGFGSIKEQMMKSSAKREKRMNELYSMDADYSNYSTNCPDHPGVRRFHVGLDECAKLGYSKTELVWKCPIDEKVYVADGSVAEQTKGFSSMNNLRHNQDSIIDDGFDAAEKLSKAMWGEKL